MKKPNGVPREKVTGCREPAPQNPDAGNQGRPRNPHDAGETPGGAPRVTRDVSAGPWPGPGPAHHYSKFATTS